MNLQDASCSMGEHRGASRCSHRFAGGIKCVIARCLIPESGMFTADHIYERMQDRPFKPLRIVTSSGESYDVYHPELVVVGNDTYL
jgi:hypothetical protein